MHLALPKAPVNGIPLVSVSCGMWSDRGIKNSNRSPRVR